jgi:hypothetical protein
MCKKGKKHAKNGPLVPPRAKEGFFGQRGIVLVFTVVAVLGFLWHHLRQPGVMPMVPPIVEAAPP